MITNPVDYYSKILQIKDINRPQYALLLPTDETIYEIDLFTRQIKAPKFLSLHKDVYAETIYFKVDRFFDNMDLADTVCVIQYLNSGDKEDNGKIYLVPFIDISTYRDESKMLIPWQISGQVARAPGTITFAFKFYKINENGDEIYSLNTSPATSKILTGLDLKLPENDEGYMEAEVVDKIYADIDAVSKSSVLYWIEV